MIKPFAWLQVLLPSLLQKMIMFTMIMGVNMLLMSTSLLYASDSTNNNNANNNRPKTALVLSGGGARGAAHVGVLKVLEELKIPIDYVVGTSMGSIIGGLYSAGYSPDELETLLKTLDWDAALQDKPSRDILSFRRKQADKDLLGIEVGFHDGKFTVPEGVLAGQELGFILKNAIRRVGHISSFDKLPIPFRAVATDLNNGELVPLSQGDLAKAIRASVSVSGVFVPVTIDGRKLVDGGLVGNLPVQVARDMGADRIIAVDIGSGLIDEDKLGNVLNVSLQMINVLMKQNVDNSIAALQAGDLFLRPDLGDFSSGNFKEAHTIIKHGYKEASSKRISLSNFSVSPQAYAKWQKTQRRTEAKKAPTIAFVEVKGNERVDEQQIRARMKQQVGTPLDTKTLGKDLSRIYAIGDFETVDYDLIRQATGRTGLVINVKEKPWGPHYLRGAIQLSDDFEGGGSYNLLLNHRWTQLNRLGGEWENTIEIGKRRGFTTEFYQPLTYDGRFFISPQFKIGEDTVDVYNGNNRVGEYAVDQTRVKLDVGWIPHNDTEVRLGLEYAKIKGNLRVGSRSPFLPNAEADIGAINVAVGVDRQDNPYFPTQGVRAEFNLKVALDELGSDDEYNLAAFNVGKSWSIDKHVFGTNMLLASSFNSDLPVYEDFSLGGLGKLSGLNKDQLRGPHLGLINAIYYRPLGEKILGNIGFSLEAGNVWQESNEVSTNDLIYSGSVFWSYDSPIGALYFGYGLTDEGNEAVHFTLGQPF